MDIEKYATSFYKSAMEKKKSSCVLIEQNGKVLGVARRGTTDQFGLPGGKLEPNESFLEAAIRETKEETGIDLDPGALTKVYSRMDGEYYAVTFKYHGDVGSFSKGDAGTVRWIEWQDLFEGPFGSYNRDLFNSVHGDDRAWSDDA